MIVHAIGAGFGVGEVPCPARYEPDSSSIGLRRSVEYGLGVLRLSWRHRRTPEKRTKNAIIDGGVRGEYDDVSIIIDTFYARASGHVRDILPICRETVFVP